MPERLLVTEGRPAKYCGWVQYWPIRLDPIGLPLTQTSEPLACEGKITWATPVVTSGYAIPSISVSSSVSMMAGRNWRSTARQPVSRGSWLAGSTGIGVAVLAVCGLIWLIGSPSHVGYPSLSLLFWDLVRQIERGQDQVDRLDADKRQDDPAEAVDQEVAP